METVRFLDGMIADYEQVESLLDRKADEIIKNSPKEVNVTDFEDFLENYEKIEQLEESGNEFYVRKDLGSEMIPVKIPRRCNAKSR